MLPFVDAAKQNHLDRPPQDTCQDRDNDEGSPKSDWTLQLLSYGIGEVRSYHVKRTMGKINNARHTENESQSRGHDKKDHRATETAYKLGKNN